MSNVAALIPTLQVAIGPVVLISGIGLLILSMTNRLGRVIDRGRTLAHELSELPPEGQARIEAQLHILLFFTAALRLELAWLVSAVFVGSLGALIFSLVAFLRDLNESLLAFKLEIGMPPKDKWMP